MSLPSLTVRTVRPDDVAAITAIYRPAVLYGTASFELDPPDESEMRRRLEAILQAGHAYLVACSGDKVIAYAYYAAYRPRPAYRFTVENSIYVAPEAQGQGVGRLLLGELIRRAEAASLRQMVAVIGDSGQKASISLHKSLGFQDCGIVRSVGFKHGRWHDQVIMQRPLGPGDAEAPAL